MIIHGNRPADDSYEKSCLISFRKFAKMSQNVSSAAVMIGALRIKFMILLGAFHTSQLYTVYCILRRKSLVRLLPLCAIILLVSLNIDKNRTQHEILLIFYKCEHFQQNILKINPFSSSKSH